MIKFSLIHRVACFRLSQGSPQAPVPSSSSVFQGHPVDPGCSCLGGAALTCAPGCAGGEGGLRLRGKAPLPASLSLIWVHVAS